MKHLLAVRFSSLGDVVLLSGPLAWLRAQRPELRISVATKAAFAPLLEGQAWVDGVWVLETEGLLGLAARARREGVDAVVDLHGSLRSTLLDLMFWGKVTRWDRAALRRWAARSPWILHIVPEGRGIPPHVAWRYAEALARACGLTPPLATSPPAPVFLPTEAALAEAQALLEESGVRGQETLIGVVPGAAWATKRWPREHFSAALDGLASRLPLRFALLGAPSEAEVCRAVIDGCGAARDRCVSLAGRTPLPVLAALLSRCKLVLSNDSGPMHLAGAVGAKVVAFFGPTVEAFGFFPLAGGAQVLQKELPCRPCSLHGGDACPIGTHECMKGISPEAALEAALGDAGRA